MSLDFQRWKKNEVRNSTALLFEERYYNDQSLCNWFPEREYGNQQQVICFGYTPLWLGQMQKAYKIRCGNNITHLALVRVVISCLMTFRISSPY